MARYSIVEGALDFEVDGRMLGLTLIEFELLQLLASRAGSYVLRRDIGEAVWGYFDIGLNRTIETHFNRIRRKLLPAELIVTKRGVGYAFVGGAAGDRGREPGVIWILDEERRIAWAQDGIEKVLGWTAAELLHRIVYDIIDPADRARSLRLREVIDGGDVVDTKMLVLGSSGEAREVFMRASIVLRADGGRLGYVGQLWNAQELIPLSPDLKATAPRTRTVKPGWAR